MSADAKPTLSSMPEGNAHAKTPLARTSIERDQWRERALNAEGLMNAHAELVAACVRIADEMQSASSAGDSVAVDSRWLDRRIKVLRAALAKARGTTCSTKS